MHVQINTLHIVSVTHLYLILSRERGLNISLIQPRQTTAPQSQRGSGEDSAALSGSSSQPGLRFWVGWNGRSGPSEWQPFIVVRNGEVWSWSVAMQDRGRRRKKRTSGLHYSSGGFFLKKKGYTKSRFVLDYSTLPVLFKPSSGFQLI